MSLIGVIAAGTITRGLLNKRKRTNLLSTRLETCAEIIYDRRKSLAAFARTQQMIRQKCVVRRSALQGRKLFALKRQRAMTMIKTRERAFVNHAALFPLA